MRHRNGVAELSDISRSRRVACGQCGKRRDVDYDMARSSATSRRNRMRTSRAIAVWLFDRLDLDSALFGDLLEERARGRSAFWYWRQVVIAMCLVIWRACSITS